MKIPKYIIVVAQFLQFFSLNWATRFATNLFLTPIKFKRPKRELELFEKAEKTTQFFDKINKKAIVYTYGSGSKKALLVHGWCGRGTQLVKIATMLQKFDFQIITFDAPGHGDSPKNKTNMTEFIAIILTLEKQFSGFDVAIGHSLGGMAILNACKQGLQLKKAVTIGSGDIIDDIMDEFVLKLKLKPVISPKMKEYYETNYGIVMDNLSAYKAAEKTTCPTLIIHDEDDKDVPVSCAYNIDKHHNLSELYITKHLGHRKILGDKNVVLKIEEFVAT
jgi:pimeloyl-ACP methyl ester carboxylesterase